MKTNKLKLSGDNVRDARFENAIYARMIDISAVGLKNRENKREETRRADAFIAK